jgi:lysophospholipase L1-like esterase
MSSKVGTGKVSSIVHNLLKTKENMMHSVFARRLGLSVFSALCLVGAEKTSAAESEIHWSDLRQLGVEGRGWSDTTNFYDRLPARAERLVRPPVWNLAHDSAGLCARFVTDANEIRARWTLTDSWLYQPNATAIAVSGLDLYVKVDSGWRWLAAGVPQAQTNEVTLVKNMLPGKREYLLYLPLYNGVKFAELGIPAHSVLEKAPSWGPGERKPVVFYGTSIVQGLAASRPGMVHTALLQRRFNWPVINLGFSGNGKMEPEMADLLAELDPAVYVIDCLPNMVSEEIKARTVPFIHKLRAAHPGAPIVLVEDRTMQDSFLIAGRMEWYHLKSRAALRSAYEQLQAEGIKQLYYIPGEHLLGDDGEGSTDGSHPNDLGFTRQADIFAQVLGPLLPCQNLK